MMDTPRIGAPSGDYRAVCTYSLRPGTPRCERPATSHIRSASPQWGEVSLLACDDHVSIARAAGDALQEHAVGVWCGLPATIWDIPTNTCVLDGSGSPAAERAEARTAIP